MADFRLWILLYFTIIIKAQETFENRSLSNVVLPEKYMLWLVPFFSNFTFRGEVSINIQIPNLTNNITLYAEGLNISKISMVQINPEIINTSFTFNSSSEEGNILINSVKHFNGRYNLTISFTGRMNDIRDEEGLYYNSYIDGESIMYYAMSRSYPFEGGTFFPCFNDPSLQAPFHIHIARFSNQSSQSNMALESTSMPDVSVEGRVWDVYYETPNISVHQVECSVHQFRSLNNSIITIWAAADVTDQATLALSLLQTAERALLQWLPDTSYHLPKLDILAVPDHSTEMYHTTGLVTCRENLILYQEGVCGVAARERVVDTVADITVRQTFDQPVITNLWLAQGIYKYVQYRTLSIMEPSWRSDEMFVLEILQEAFMDDLEFGYSSNQNTSKHSKRVAAILKMLERMSSENSTRYALQRVANFRGIVKNDQIIATFKDEPVDVEGAGDWSLGAVLEAWLSQPQQAIVSVTTANNSFRITQSKPERPLLLTFTTEQDVKINASVNNVWLSPAQEVTNITTDVNNGWVICNINQQGFYRVNYSMDNWLLLSDQLMSDHRLLTAVTRAQLIDDAFKLALQEQLNFSIPFKITEYLIHEYDRIPWIAATINMDRLIKLFYGTPLSMDLQRLAQTLISPYFNRTYLAASEDREALLSRRQVLWWACHWQLTACQAFTAAMFNQWLSTSIGFPPDLKLSALCTGVRLFPSAFTQVFDSFTYSEVDSDRRVFLSALACTQHIRHLHYLLSVSFLYNGAQYVINLNDKVFLFDQIVSQPENIHFVLMFLVAYYDHIIYVLGDKLMESVWDSLGRNMIMESDIEYLRTVVQDETLTNSLQEGLNYTLAIAEDYQNKSRRLAPLVTAALYQGVIEETARANSVSSHNILNYLILMLGMLIVGCNHTLQ